MSSYLTFYIVPKEGNKPIALLNYSRNNDIYQYFVDNVKVAFIGMEENPQYTELTEEKGFKSVVVSHLDKLSCFICFLKSRVNSVF